jgi:hypothetical protein
MSDESIWEQRPGEPIRWFERFDRYYRPLGAGRSLLLAYKKWEAAEAQNSLKKAEKGRKRQIKSAPTSWREAAKLWRWESRAEAWDLHQLAEEKQAEQEVRERSKERRIALLNATLAKAFEALNMVNLTHARIGEVGNVVRLVVQELRQEYEGKGSAPAGSNLAQLPTPAGVTADTDDQTLDHMIENLWLMTQLDRQAQEAERRLSA